MKKIVLSLLSILMLTILLVACSSQPSTQAAVTTTQAAFQNQTAGTPGAPGGPVDPADQPIEQKLAIGTLKLEGTDLAVTGEQAKTLLPLWKAVKALSSSETVSQDEVNAVYSQIQEAMTAEQITAIKEMTLNPEDIQTLMKDLGVEIQMPQEGERPQLSEEQLATMQARRDSLQQGQTQGQGRQGGGPSGAMPGGAGMPPGGMEGGMPGGVVAGTPGAQGAPQAGMMGPRGAGGGFTTTLVEPLITLLEERAGS